MKDFWQLLIRFVPPYKKYFIGNILCNILTAFLTLFSFAVIIPILEILFGINKAEYTFLPLGSASLKDVVVNNFYYYTTICITEWGASATLALLALLLVVMTGLKTGTAYLASYLIIPMRAGVVRDLRNYVYDKVTTLPISFSPQLARAM